MSEKWTKGPWEAVVPSNRHIFEGSDITQYFVLASSAYHDEDHVQNKELANQFISKFDFDEFVANARLIAAAPDLYEALKRLVSERHTHQASHDDADRCEKCGRDLRNTDVHYRYGEDYASDRQMADAALAKARGE